MLRSMVTHLYSFSHYGNRSCAFSALSSFVSFNFEFNFYRCNLSSVISVYPDLNKWQVIHDSGYKFCHTQYSLDRLQTINWIKHNMWGRSQPAVLVETAAVAAKPAVAAAKSQYAFRNGYRFLFGLSPSVQHTGEVVSRNSRFIDCQAYMRDQSHIDLLHTLN